jgi:two-component system, NtrC family, sensor kinase
MGRLRIPHVERLTLRIAIGVSLLLLGPLAGGLYLLSALQYSHAVEARRGAAELENRILETTLRHDMLTRDARLMTDTLREIGREPEVLRAMIIDHNGIIKLSSRSSEVGIQTSKSSPTCLVCHSEKPADRKRWVTFKEGGADVLRTVLPIENRPECHGCHDAATRLNGMMVLDVSLSQVQAQFRSDVRWLGGGTAVVALVMLGGLGWHLRRVVLSRLATLTRTARAIAGGALGERADTTGDDAIASLATDFNAMADATSRLIAEIRQREQQLSGVLNGLDDGLIVLGRDFRVIAANRSIAKWLGSHPEALRGQQCRHVAGHALPCCDDPDCPTARCLATGRLAQATYRLPARDGADERVYEIYASPVYADDGSVGQVVEAWRDITDRVREEEHFAEIERLSSLGILASGLSHEVNTPLATTLTCAEGIIDQLPDAAAPPGAATIDAIRDSALVIRDQVLRCRTITRQFLGFARGIPPATEPIDLGHVVDGVLALAAPAARAAGVELVRDANGPLPLVSANTEVVQHVALNLLVNAIESCGDQGGRVTVRFGVGEDVRLQVCDNGCGMPPDAQRHLFEPFRTQKPNGTGLGLFLSRRFMRRFGGDVRLVESAVGCGSCIEVVFPVSDSEAP